MEIFQSTFEVATSGRGLFPITERVKRELSQSGLQAGLCTVFIRHTSASLIIQENADPNVLRDLDAWLGELAPESRSWVHDDEGPDDMPAHAKSAITKTSESIPFSEGKLVLGTWQGLFIVEHRKAPHQRSVFVHIMGTRHA
jgi:secondary thiamine-phosphate synthase enzyme